MKQHFFTLSTCRLALLAGLLSTLIGCTSEETIQAKAEQESRLKAVSVLYGQYIGRHRGRPPSDEAAFRAFLEKEGTSLMDTFGIASVDELLTSERDQQPYVIIYGREKPLAGPEGMEVIAHEQQGVEGRVFVANNLGAVAEIDAAELMK
jgi:hypothetical protein